MDPSKRPGSTTTTRAAAAAAAPFLRGGLPPDILGERHRNNSMYIESGTVELGAPVIPPFAAEIQSV